MTNEVNESVELTPEEAAANGTLSAFATAAGNDWGYKPSTISKLMMLGYFLDEDSDASTTLTSIFDLVLNVGPRNHGRVIAYLHNLTDNLANDPHADPKSYAREVLRAKDESA